MGSNLSANETVDKEDLEKIEELKMISNFSDKELNRLIRIFNQLDLDKSGTIVTQELFQMKEFRANPFIHRITKVSLGKEDDGDNTSLSIQEFAQLMSVFSIRATREQKLRYAFKIYDVDGDGKISREDLKETLQLITMSNDADFLEEVLDQVFQEADSDEDGFILFEDFSKVVMNSDIEGKLTIDF
mmetsp:Transcript_9496/g.21559  ORF Transcript_9496/g.21559 Transcript_9496/m.21559 type:complete len:187 (-) Transcript_9496:48-608(-)